MLPIKLFQLVFSLFRFNRNIETLCFGMKRNNRNKRFVLDSAETCFGSSFGCFDSKLVSKDTLGWRVRYSDYDVFKENYRGSRVYRCKKQS
jgi:hypothetical protein